MQAEVYHVFRSGDSTTPLYQVSDRSISFLGCILFVDCGLHKQGSSGAQVISNDWATCSKPVQTDIFRILLARNFNFWQWTLLHFWCFYQCNECIPYQSYYKLTPLSTIWWTCWKVCIDCENFILQGKRRGERSIQMFDDLPQYTS